MKRRPAPFTRLTLNSVLAEKETYMASKKLSISCFVIFFFLSLLCANASEFKIEINRTSENTNSITGELFVNDKFVSHTLELPWKDNRSFISSIPPGTYRAILRYDKADRWRLQLDNVPKRSEIQIHIGNYPSQIEGCVLVGSKTLNDRNSIEQSTAAYNELKRLFYGSNSPKQTPNLKLEVKIAYHPARTSFFSKQYTLNYEEQGRWQVRTNKGNYSFVESYRDREYVYIHGVARGKKRHVRVPLFGGKLASANSLNGPWSSKNAPVVTRNN